ADHGDDRSSDHRREELHHFGEERRNDQTDDGGTDHGTENGLDLRFGGRALERVAADYRQHRGHAGERDALDQRELAPEEGQSPGLQDGGDSTDEKARGYQQRNLGRTQARSLTDDERDSNDAPIHGQDVLQAIRKTRNDPETLVFRALAFGMHGGCRHIVVSFETGIRWSADPDLGAGRPSGLRHVKDGIVFQASSLGVVPLRTTSAVMSP